MPHEEKLSLPDLRQATLHNFAPDSVARRFHQQDIFYMVGVTTYHNFNKKGSILLQEATPSSLGSDERHFGRNTLIENHWRGASW